MNYGGVEEGKNGKERDGHGTFALTMKWDQPIESRYVLHH